METRNKMEPEFERMAKAFPKSVGPVVKSLSEKLTLNPKTEPYLGFSLVLDGEELEIPYRIYFNLGDIPKLSDRETLLTYCYFTRHFDGFVREESLKKIIKCEEYFTTPFIIQLVGEYVVQNQQVVLNNLNEPLLKNIRKFKSENEEYFKKTTARVNSYWDCFYRRDEFPKWENYPGNKIMKKINEFNSEGKSV
ncbi:MAG: hypothetical protein JWO30_4467 [Fibrobacteres bacterium]|nr:hypothetical protein [Fibrobacterota bacterium]